MSLKIVQTINKLSPSVSSASTTSGISLKTGYIRVSTGTTGAYVAIGTDPVATTNSFHIPPNSTEIIKETPIRQRLSGIATGSSTVITFPDGSGNYFSVGDYVTIEGASPTGINTVHMPVTAVTSTTATVAYASQSVTGVSVNGSTSLVKSLKVSAIGAGAGCDVSIAEVQIVSQA
jgi:hypothetical protein